VAQSSTEPLPPDLEGLFDRQHVDEDVFLQVLKEAVAAIEGADLPYVMIGGIPSSVMGRNRWTEDGADIDFFVKAQNTKRALEALEEAGFRTKEAEPHWLFKATKDRVVVDVIYRSSGDIYLDDEMVERSFGGQFKGVPVRLVPAEDLVVMKAIAHREETARYWHDALGILGRAELDWEYLLRRARQYGARRVLSLLVYAQSNDIAVPNHVIRDLFSSIYEE
jgi:predicted nucleotidyltransferase